MIGDRAMKKDLIAAEIRYLCNGLLFVFIFFLSTNFHTTFRSRVAIADVETETIELSEKEIADLKTLTYYYDATLSKPTSKEREKRIGSLRQTMRFLAQLSRTRTHSLNSEKNIY